MSNWKSETMRAPSYLQYDAEPPTQPGFDVHLMPRLIRDGNGELYGEIRSSVMFNRDGGNGSVAGELVDHTLADWWKPVIEAIRKKLQENRIDGKVGTPNMRTDFGNSISNQDIIFPYFLMEPILKAFQDENCTPWKVQYKRFEGFYLDTKGLEADGVRQIFSNVAKSILKLDFHEIRGQILGKELNLAERIKTFENFCND